MPEDHCTGVSFRTQGDVARGCHHGGKSSRGAKLVRLPPKIDGGQLARDPVACVPTGGAGERVRAQGAVAATMASAIAGRAVAMVVPTSARLTGLDERARAGLGEARDSESLGESCGSPLPMGLSAD